MSTEAINELSDLHVGHTSSVDKPQKLNSDKRVIERQNSNCSSSGQNHCGKCTTATRKPSNNAENPKCVLSSSTNSATTATNRWNTAFKKALESTSTSDRQRKSAVSFKYIPAQCVDHKTEIEEPEQLQRLVEGGCTGVPTEKYISKKKYYFKASLTIILVLFGVVACLFTVQLIQDLIQATKFPVRSIMHKSVNDYKAPGIVVFPGQTTFRSCHNFSQLEVETWDTVHPWHLTNCSCQYTNYTYTDDRSSSDPHNVIIFKGPTNVTNKETLFLHFVTSEDTLDFYSITFLLFDDWEKFQKWPNDVQRLKFMRHLHSHTPIYSASAGLRMWNKMSMTKMEIEDDDNKESFPVFLDLEYSLVRYWEKASNSTEKLFFLFFEWKNNIITESYIMRTQSIWSVGAALCGVFLTLHKGYSLAVSNFKELRETRARRKRSKKFKRHSMHVLLSQIHANLEAKNSSATIPESL